MNNACCVSSRSSSLACNFWHSLSRARMRLKAAKLTTLATLYLLASGCGRDSSTDPGAQEGMPIVQAFSPTGLNADIDLFLFSVDGARRRRLVGLPGTESSPRWSPDGK